jgi:hypothetical protein
MLSVVATSSMGFAPQGAPGSMPLSRARVSSPAMLQSSEVNRRAALLGAGFTALVRHRICGWRFRPSIRVLFERWRDVSIWTHGRPLFLAQAALPNFAGAEEDDAIYKIAEKTRLANEKAKQEEAERIKNMSARAQGKKENDGAGIVVNIALAGSFFFSLPFFYKNLARLGLKFRSVVDSSIDESQYKR